MSYVHKPFTGRRLLTQSPRNEYGRSSIDVHKPSFLDVPSLAAPTSHGPCPEADGRWFKKTCFGTLLKIWQNLAGSKIEQCGLSRSWLFMALPNWPQFKAKRCLRNPGRFSTFSAPIKKSAAVCLFKGLGRLLRESQEIRVPKSAARA